MTMLIEPLYPCLVKGQGILRVASYALQVASWFCELRVEICELRVGICELRVGISELQSQLPTHKTNSQNQLAGPTHNS